MKADHIGLEIAEVLARKRFGLDLVESRIVIEQLDHRAAAVRPLDRKLTAVNLVDAGGNIEPHRGGLRQRLDRKVDDGTFLKVGAFEFSHRHLENEVVLAERIDPRRNRAAWRDLKDCL